jgi:hypothetical protein
MHRTIIKWRMTTMAQEASLAWWAAPRIWWEGYYLRTFEKCVKLLYDMKYNMQKSKFCQLHQANNSHNTRKSKIMMSQANKMCSTWKAWSRETGNYYGHNACYVGKHEWNDECIQQFKCPQCEQETHFAEFQLDTKLKAKAKVTIQMV